MVHSLTVILLGLLCAASARAELVLTPTVDEYELDGVKFKRLAFRDGEKKVTYQAPSGWEYSGSGSKLTLRPPQKAQAEATIATVALPKPGTFDEEGAKHLTEEAIAALPKATNLQIISQSRNTLMINGKETFLIIMSYDLFSEKYQRSILFLNRGDEQIRCQLTCRAVDFDLLHKAFFSSQFSWQNL